MLDGVLRWLVQVTGLEPKLLTLTAILIVYAASVYPYAKEKTGVPSVAPAQPLELADFSSALARVERGVETVATYLVSLENQPQNQPHEHVSACPFLPPRGAGSPPLSHHRPDFPFPDCSRMAVPQVEEIEEPYFPVPGMAKTQLGFFDPPIPVIEPLDIQPEAHRLPHREQQHEPEAQEPEPKTEPDLAVRRTLEIVSRKAGRTLP